MKRALALLPLLAAGCRPGASPAPESALAPPPIYLTEIKDALDFTSEVTGPRPLNALQTIGRGCALLDADGDGDLDALMVAPQPVLFRGDGAGRFVRSALIPSLNQAFIGCAVGDYDGDGFEDIYLSAYRGGALLHNEAGKGFRDVTRASGIAPQPFGTACAWVETRPGSGRLDLIVANYARFGADLGQPLLCDAHATDGKTIRTSCPPRQYAPLPAVLFQNLGGGRFAQRSTPTTGRGLGVAAADPEGVGATVIALANDEIAGDLLTTRGPMRNAAATAGVAYDRDGNIHGGMGLDWGDIDNDGRLDLFVSTFHDELKSLYRNEGEGIYSDVSPTNGVGTALRPFVSFGCRLIDFDNDGWLDLIVANGHVQDNIAAIDPAQTYRQPTALLRNAGGGTFVDVSRVASPALGRPIVGRGVAAGDIDNDGRTDVLIGDLEGRPLLLHNESRPNPWIGFSLTGTRSNRSGLGATVRVTAGGKTFVRHVHTDGSYLSASDRRLVIGLGPQATLDRVEVLWPSGKRQVVANAALGRYNAVTEPH